MTRDLEPSSSIDNPQPSTTTKSGNVTVFPTHIGIHNPRKVTISQ
jgi:hypothetical protein